MKLRSGVRRYGRMRVNNLTVINETGNDSSLVSWKVREGKCVFVDLAIGRAKTRPSPPPPGPTQSIA